jgi:hypothetical protein
MSCAVSHLASRPDVDAGDGQEAADGAEGGGGRAGRGFLDGGVQAHEAVPDPARGYRGRPRWTGPRGPDWLVGCGGVEAPGGGGDGEVDQLVHEFACYGIGVVVHGNFAADHHVFGDFRSVYSEWLHASLV